MAVQMIINKRNKAALARKLAGEQAAGADIQLGPHYKSGYGPGRTTSDASDLSDGDGIGKFGPVGLEDGMDIIEMDDKRIVNKVYDLIRENHEKKKHYFNLVAFMTFVTLYLTTLYLQLNTFQTFLVTSSFNSLLPSDGGGIATEVSSPADIYDYLNSTIIQPLWADPVCGDGICDRPIEFAGFGRFGCTPDCGPMDAADVTIVFQTSFDTSQDQEASSWNLCMTYPDNLCWFAEPQLFSDQTATIVNTLSLPNGTWQMVLTSPHRGLQGNVKTKLATGSGSPGSDGYEVLASWGNCVPDDESDLVRCRSICAQNAKCAADACSNLNDSDIPQVFIDCSAICNKNATILDPYQNVTCLQAISAASKSSSSFLGVASLNCTVDDAYLAANPVQVALGQETPPPTPTPSSANSSTFKGGTGRRLQQSVDPTSGNATLLYWNKFGSTDGQRYRTLATALSRALHTWSIDSCLCPYALKAATTGPPMLGFLCAYFGGPPEVQGCVYTDPATGNNLTSANFPELQAVLERRYGPGGRFNISQAEQDRFITILLNAVQSTIAFGYGSGDALNLEARLHYADTAVVALPGDNCNTANVILPWKLNVHQATNISAGDSIQWTWQDDLPHALISLNVPENSSIFTSTGSGRQIISRQTLCTPQNILSFEDGTFTKDPVPCIVGTTSAGNVQGSFSHTHFFNETGTFEYTDTRYTTAMTGVINVGDFVVSVANNASTTPIAFECAPGCQIGSLNNGLCDTACNNDACAFDGGDCSCPDTSSVAATPSAAPGASSASCSCPGDQIRGSDGSCCQSQVIGDHLQLPFDVILVELNSESIFDPANYTRTRYASNHNRLLGGLMLHQTRLEGERCKEKRFANLFQYCVASGLSKSPFGADPVFNPTSTLYNDQLNLADFYLENELSPLGTPYGFFPKKTTGKRDGFPLVFDINLDQNGAQNRLQYLMDGLFLDNATDVLTVQLVTYNGVEKQFVDMSLYFTFQRGGKIAVNYDVSGVSVELYTSPLDYFRACLEIIVALAVFYNIFSEIKEAVHLRRDTGSALNYFATLYNYVDVVSLSLMFTAIMLWIVFISTKALPFDAAPRYEIYESLLAEARFWGMKVPSQFHDFAKMVSDVNALVVYRSIYAAINGINIFFMIVRIFKLFDFQPRMGVITRSLALAGPELLNFFILWLIFFVGYSFMAHMIFGRSVEDFRSLPWSLTACFLMILGDTGNEYALMKLNGWELVASQIFFYSFQIFMVFIIMQFLVAIAVDAFAEVKDRTPDNAPGMFEEVLSIGKEKVERITNKRYSDKKLLRKLHTWEGFRPKKVEYEEDEVDPLRRTASSDVHGEMVEKKLVLKLDADEVDKEKLEAVFGRSATYQAHEEVTPEVAKIADQVLAEYGEEVIKKKRKKKVKKQQIPNMKEDMKNLKSEVKTLRELISDLTSALHQRFDDVQEDMAHAGISRSTIPEELRHASSDPGQFNGDT